MAYQVHVVPGFGGGLNFSQHPAFIEDNEWAFSDGWKAKDGVAETLRGYTQKNDGTWLPAATTSGGIVPDLLSTANGPDGSVLLLSINNATNVIRMFRLRPDGVLAEIGSVAVFPVGDIATFSCIPMAAVNLGVEVIALGGGAIGGNFSLLQYDTGLGTFTAVAPANPLKLSFLVASGSRLLGAVTGVTAQSQFRQVRVSDSGSNIVWDALISNTADTIDLPGFGRITGMAPWRNGAIVLTQERVYALEATGGVSPYTVQIVEERGSRQSYGQRIVATPYGIFYDGDDDIYVMGQGGVGRKIYAYLMNLRVTDQTVLAKMLWSAYHGAVLCPHNSEHLAFDPVAQAWWRRTTLNAGFHDQAVAWDGTVAPSAHWFITTGTPAVLREDTTGTSQHAGNFVDSKDFAFGSPPFPVYLDRIMVDWESLTNISTDTLQVSAAVRNDLHTTLGAPGLQLSDLSATVLGTLTGGSGQLQIRTKGKFCRFRFKMTSGRGRIRGFSIRWKPAGDR